MFPRPLGGAFRNAALEGTSVTRDRQQMLGRRHCHTATWGGSEADDDAD